MQKKNVVSSKMITGDLKRIALLMAAHCVRNTIIEEYHSKGQLSDSDMMKFNKEVTNKLYSFLEILLNPKYFLYSKEMLYSQPLAMPWLYAPSNWDTPKFDKEFRHLMSNVLKMHRRASMLANEPLGQSKRKRKPKGPA